MTNAYLAKDDCNVIQVDWKTPAAEPFYVSAHNTKGVGEYLFDFGVAFVDGSLGFYRLFCWEVYQQTD